MKSNFVYCTYDLIDLHLLGFFFFFFSEKNPVLLGSNSRPNVSEDYEVPLSHRGDRQVENDYVVRYTEFDFTVDGGKGRLNPSRDKKLRQAPLMKGAPVWPSSCVTPAGAST